MKKISRVKFVSIAALVFLLTTINTFPDSIYGNVPRLKYLMGEFSRTSVLKAYTNKVEKNVHYLHPEAAEAFEKMKEAYETDREGKSKQHLFIVSAHRAYGDQKMIWEEKYRGNRKMRESVTGKTPEQIVDLILEYSSAPGTSRHHWGTDMDLNALQNDYFVGKGNGAYLYQWLKDNAHKYGFCQPYNELDKRGGKGYKEEKWHWSYAPISNKLMEEWEKAFKSGEITFKGKFLGSDILGERPLEYVTSINSDCKKIK